MLHYRLNHFLRIKAVKQKYMLGIIQNQDTLFLLLFPDWYRIWIFFKLIFCFLNHDFELAGVASGATRAALTQHFALQDNAADISAKV